MLSYNYFRTFPDDFVSLRRRIIVFVRRSTSNFPILSKTTPGTVPISLSPSPPFGKTLDFVPSKPFPLRTFRSIPNYRESRFRERTRRSIVAPLGRRRDSTPNARAYEQWKAFLFSRPVNSPPRRRPDRKSSGWSTHVRSDSVRLVWRKFVFGTTVAAARSHGVSVSPPCD